MKKILIADDHAVVREGLKLILSEAEDFLVVGEAADGEEVLQMIEERDFDLLILDISMPGRSGLEILEIVKNRRPSLPVLILSMHPAEQFAMKALETGASGYLGKESIPEELIFAATTILEGKKYLPPDLANLLPPD